MEDSLVQWSLGSVLPVYTFVFRHPCFHYVGQRQHRTPRGHGGDIDYWRSGAGMAMYIMPKSSAARCFAVRDP
jgi:hypothetical protein